MEKLLIASYAKQYFIYRTNNGYELITIDNNDNIKTTTNINVIKYVAIRIMDCISYSIEFIRGDAN